MLTEFENLRQEATGFRRLFFDRYFDLYVWYDREGGSLTGFQLVYDKAENPHSLTWIEREGYSHNKIDEGERTGAMKMSPILVPDGTFDRETVAASFRMASDPLDPSLRKLVIEKLERYGEGVHRAK